jgi:hypothetical protein
LRRLRSSVSDRKIKNRLAVRYMSDVDGDRYVVVLLKTQT